MTQIVAFSGGKDSTAMALRMHELGEDFDLLFTPTGRELPELEDHISMIESILGKKAIRPDNRSLDFWINEFNGLPNWRMRWCTRLIKIVPCIAHLQRHPGSTLCVGLRADEESRVGLYGDYAYYRYPMQEWGWKIGDVVSYLASKKTHVPDRTDCDCCYGQRIGEWHRLWLFHPERYAECEGYETMTGHTFRSSQRDTWPASLAELRKEFERGRVPKSGKSTQVCRVCSL